MHLLLLAMHLLLLALHDRHDQTPTNYGFFLLLRVKIIHEKHSADMCGEKKKVFQKPNHQTSFAEKAALLRREPGSNDSKLRS